MNRRWTWTGRVVAAGAAHTLGSIAGSGLVGLLSLPTQQVPPGTEYGHQLLLTLLGGIAVAVGLSGMASGLTGRWWQRWTILASFAVVVNGLGTALETRIFTTLGGETALVAATLPSSLLCALVVTRLFPPDQTEGFLECARKRLAQRPPSVHASRLAVAFLAFPAIYLLFGGAAAPVVTPFYDHLDFMNIPPFGVMIETQLARSALFLFVSWPVVLGWTRSRGGLLIALALGHFTMVGLSGLIQTRIFPTTMAYAHGLEILADSLAYAWALTSLLFPIPDPARTSGAPSRLTFEAARVFRAAAAVLCFIAIGHWPDGYYLSVRLVVLTACLMSLFVARSLGWSGWSLTFGLLAIVFNPLLPMPFSRELWMAVDGIGGTVLLASTALSMHARRVQSPASP